MKKITYGDVYKRKMILESKTSDYVSKNCSMYRRSAYTTPDKYNILKFINECAKSSEMSTKYHRDIKNLISLEASRRNGEPDKELEEAYHDTFLLLAPGFIAENNIYTVSNNLCDRIISNHDHIATKFHIETVAKENANSLDVLVNKVCDAVSKFSLPIHAKICVSLEEYNYLVDKNQYISEDMTDTVLRYFLIKEGTDMIPLINKSIKNSLILESDALDKTKSDIVDSFVTAPVKNTDLLLETLKSVMESDASQLPVHLSEFLKMSREIIITGDEDLYNGLYQKVIPEIYNLFYNRIDSPEAKSLLGIIISVISTEISEDKVFVAKYHDTNIESIFTYYIAALSAEKDKLMELNNRMYTAYNMNTMIESTYVDNDYTVFNLEEAKVFKHENLLNIVKHVDDAIANRFKASNEATKNKMIQIRKKIFGESSVYDIIGEYKNDLDYIVCTYESTKGYLDHESISDICKFINESDLNTTPYKLYYLQLSESTCEFHLFSNHIMFNLTESEKEECDSIENIPEELKYDINSMLLMTETIPDELFDEDLLKKYIAKIDNYNDYHNIIELCSMAGIYEDVMETAVQDSPFSLKEYVIEDVPAEVQLEALNALNDLVLETVNGDIKKKLKINKDGSFYKSLKESDDKTEKDDKKNNKFFKPKKEESVNEKLKKDAESNKDKNSDKSDSSSSRGVNLASIELFLHGLRKKAKDLGSKEAELSRQIDTAFSMFVKAVKNCLVSDRREAIIKGSVIPSFSKCIKLSIAVAGIAAFNLPLAFITVIGGLAASKKLTNKERSLLLDEIEVELEILEREISNADSKGQMKKLRALMREKKNLQRQYQSIKYNIRIGKDIIPTSVGTPKGGD